MNYDKVISEIKAYNEGKNTSNQSAQNISNSYDLISNINNSGVPKQQVKPMNDYDMNFLEENHKKLNNNIQLGSKLLKSKMSKLDSQKGISALLMNKRESLCKQYKKLRNNTTGSDNTILLNMKKAQQKKQITDALSDLVVLLLAWVVGLILYIKRVMNYKTYLYYFSGVMIVIVLAMLYRTFYYQSIFEVRHFMDNTTKMFQQIVTSLNVSLTGNVPKCPGDCKVKSSRASKQQTVENELDRLDKICSSY